jgi:hypothetical protein
MTMSNVNDWNLKQQAAKTQEKFLKSRLKTLNKTADKYLPALEAAVKRYYKESLGGDCPNWEDVYHKVGDRLRRGDLTINFKSANWFARDNTYKRYTQMYQRATDAETGKTVLKSDIYNDAKTRAVIDDQVTLPAEWRHAFRFSDKWRMYHNLSFSGSAESGDQSKLTLGKDTAGTTAHHFNPHSKQAFAALNYGRRPHGSSTYYGESHLVLKPVLKEKCIYFGGDTFFLQGGLQRRGRQVAERRQVRLPNELRMAGAHSAVGKRSIGAGGFQKLLPGHSP